MSNEISLTFKQMSKEEIASTYLDVLSAWDNSLDKNEPVFISHSQKQNMAISAKQKEKE